MKLNLVTYKAPKQDAPNETEVRVKALGRNEAVKMLLQMHTNDNFTYTVQKAR